MRAVPDEPVLRQEKSTRPGVYGGGGETNGVRTLGHIVAIALLLCIPVSFVLVHDAFHRAGIATASEGGRIVVAAVRDSRIRALGVRAGDTIDLQGLSVGDRVRLLEAPMYRPFAVPVQHAGRRLLVPMTDVPPRAFPIQRVAFLIVSQTLAVCGLILGAFILWRRPGPIGFAFAAYVLNFLYALPTAEFFSFLPEPAFSVAAVAAYTFVANIPPLALVAFALRFPRPLEGPRGALVTRVLDAVLVVLCVLADWRICVVPTFYDATDPWLDVAPSFFAAAVLVVIVFTRYARTRGDDRRRLAWIAVGAVASAIATFVGDIQIEGVLPSPPWSNVVDSLLQAALPVAFAYAILRHRVLDLGFALNRTVVYSTITGTLVVLVGAVDWISGRLLGSTHLSSVVEAAVTIALGVALSWFHGRVERGVDRVLFRSRYVAAKRIDSRIKALTFASTATDVDAALVTEVDEILHLGSAAVFRRAEATTFVRTAAAGWSSSALALPENHLLLRTLRAEGQAIVLADAGIRDDAFPRGKACPDTAIPIVVRQEFLGFAVYGHRGDDGFLDPEERQMLVRLVAAAALAYDAIDAAEWRRRALAFTPIHSHG